MHEVFSTYYESPIGLIGVSGTDQYVSNIHFVDNPDEPILTQKSDTLPEMVIECVEQLIQYFQGKRKKFEIPAAQSGTAFRQKVWNELLAVPFGKTISYLELARRLGDPKVIRAAAAANGKNQLAILVPCHRVIGSNKELIGYAGGIWRKKWLLAHEAKINYGVQTLF